MKKTRYEVQLYAKLTNEFQPFVEEAKATLYRKRSQKRGSLSTLGFEGI